MTRAAEIDFEMVIEHDPISHPKDYLFQDPSYCEEDKARLNAWCSGDWSFVGVRAKAIIKFPYGSNPDCWTTSELLSPGLWSIESDSGDEYFREVYEEEREILAGMLASLNTSDFTKLKPQSRTKTGGNNDEIQITHSGATLGLQPHRAWQRHCHCRS